jgi:DNA repair exonuclease SbcCD ATPase subunit
MTTPSEEEEEEEEDEAMEKEISHILDEAEAIINEPSESVERKKEAQTLIRRAIEKSSSKTKRGEELRKRYVYISRIYYRRLIQELEVIKETLKRQIEEEEEDSASLSQSAEELKRDLEECERTIELHKELLEKIELRKG